MAGNSLKTMLSLLAIATAGIAQPARACIISKPFDFQYIKHADAVFTGELVRYERVSNGPGPADDHGLLTVTVSQIFRGNPSPTVQILYPRQNNAVPETMNLSGTRLFAGTASSSPGHPQNRVLMLQEPCSSAFILPYSPQDAEAIRFVLNGGSLEDVRAPAVSGNEGTEENGSAPATWVALALALGLAVAAAAVARVRGRKP